MKWLLLLVLLVPAAAWGQAPSTTFTWTAPGDDGNVGRATQYDARYSAVRPDTTSSSAMVTWWTAATVISGMPAPLLAGATQVVTVTPVGGFAGGVIYYFVIRTADEVPNWSGYSNVAWRLFSDTTAPAPILDLR